MYHMYHEAAKSKQLGVWVCAVSTPCISRKEKKTTKKRYKVKIENLSMYSIIYLFVILREASSSCPVGLELLSSKLIVLVCVQMDWMFSFQSK